MGIYDSCSSTLGFWWHMSVLVGSPASSSHQILAFSIAFEQSLSGFVCVFFIAAIHTHSYKNRLALPPSSSWLILHVFSSPPNPTPIAWTHPPPPLLAPAEANLLPVGWEHLARLINFFGIILKRTHNYFKFELLKRHLWAWLSHAISIDCLLKSE